MKESTYKVSECAFHVNGEHGVCAPKPTINRVRKFLISLPGYSESAVKSYSDEEVIKTAKTELKVDTEAAVYESPRVRDLIGGAAVRKTLMDYFKAEGPADSTALLDNFNIDETLSKWALHSEQMFKGKKFYHIPFQMIDFAHQGTELSTLDIKKLMDDGYSSFGVILNTDRSSGRGKHWFALYGDLAHKGTSDDPIILEYFNSSGNSPMSEVSDWMESTQQALLKDHGIYADIYRSAKRRLQNSMTECGVWSLMYILSRLKGHGSDWFYKTSANDADMIKLRKFLFRNK